MDENKIASNFDNVTKVAPIKLDPDVAKELSEHVRLMAAVIREEEVEGKIHKFIRKLMLSLFKLKREW